MNERMRVWITVGFLALAALLILAGSAVAGNPDSPRDLHVGDAIGLQPNSYWSSGWVDIAPDTATTFTHDLGGDPDNYAVELWLRDTDAGGKGVNIWGMGGFEAGGNFYGAHWQRLTDTTIEVVRRSDDLFADQVRVRVWFPDPPEWDSDWVDIAPGTLERLTHNLGGDVDDYVVGMVFKDTAPGGVGVNARCYGGMEWATQLSGAAWYNLTATTIDVWRYQDDDWADQVRVRIFVPEPPDWDSGWIDISTDETKSFTHGLGGNPGLYLVRGWQKDTAETGYMYGINHLYSGGYEAAGSFFGTSWENLTDTTINVFRRPDDYAADQVRFRIWVVDFRVYLPLVLEAHSEASSSY